MDTLTSAEKITFAALNPEKSSWKNPQMQITIGIIGAALTDLAAKGELTIQDDQLIITGSWRGQSKTVQDEIMKRISEIGKNKSVKWWISKLSGKSKKLKRTALEMLKRKNLAKIEDKKFLFIPYFIASVTNTRAHRDLISELRETLLSKDYTSSNAGVLALMDTCQMSSLLARSKSERKQIKQQLKEYAKDNAITEGMDKVIKEMQAAVMIATSSVVITSTAGR